MDRAFDGWFSARSPLRPTACDASSGADRGGRSLAMPFATLPQASQSIETFRRPGDATRLTGRGRDR